MQTYGGSVTIELNDGTQDYLDCDVEMWSDGEEVECAEISQVVLVHPRRVTFFSATPVRREWDLLSPAVAEYVTQAG